MNLSFGQKFKIISLVLIVAISKHLIILNEEILVAFSFLAFLIFSKKTFSDTINSALVARTAATRSELVNYLELKMSSTKEKRGYHEQYLKTRLSLDTISKLLSNELKNSSKSSNQLKTICLEQTRDRINLLISLNDNFSNSLQKAIISNFRSLVNK